MTVSVKEVDLCVVDLCCNEEVFSQFVEEWKAKKFSMAVAVDRHKERVVEERMVGNNRSASQAREQNRLFVDTGVVVGVAVSWSGLIVYYLSLAAGKETVLDDTP